VLAPDGGLLHLGCRDCLPKPNGNNGRSRSRGAQFDGEKLIDFGTGPIECEVIDAEIKLKTNRERMRVWSVNSDGYYIGQVPVEYEDGWLKFHIGPHYPGLYYLIMEE